MEWDRPARDGYLRPSPNGYDWPACLAVTELGCRAASGLFFESEMHPEFVTTYLFPSRFRLLRW